MKDETNIPENEKTEMYTSQVYKKFIPKYGISCIEMCENDKLHKPDLEILYKCKINCNHRI